MVHCPICNVERPDPRCGRATTMCYACCIARGDASSCSFHFNQAPPAQQVAIAARGQAAVAPPAVANSAASSLPLNVNISLPSSLVLPASNMVANVPGGLAVLPPDNAAPASSQLQQHAPSVTQPEAWREAVNLIAAQMAAISSQVASLTALVSASSSSPPVAQPSAPVSVLVAQPSSSHRSTAAPAGTVPNAAMSTSHQSIPPHRQAVLGASPTDSVAIAEMIERVMRGNNNLDEEEKEVRDTAAQQTQTQTQTPILMSSSTVTGLPPPLIQPVMHVRSTVFPSTLAPPPLGGVFTEQTVSVNGIKLTSANFFDAKKFKNIEELKTALDDWVTIAERSNWSAHHIRCIYKYRSLLVDTIAAKSSLTQALSYHLAFARAVDAHEHNMFGVDGSEYHVRSWFQVFPPAAAASPSAKKTNATRGSKKGSTGNTIGKEDKPTFAAGSCQHHPQSTTHDTASCRMNKAKPAAPKIAGT
jgi:hypothetical protein